MVSNFGAKDMRQPEGRLSPAQYEILEAIWEIGPPGATGNRVWERISKKRNVVRTTTINLINRLESRGWLKRTETDGSIVFWPTLPREEIEAEVAEDFVKCFFGGSASQLIMSFLGERKSVVMKLNACEKSSTNSLAPRSRSGRGRKASEPDES